MKVTLLTHNWGHPWVEGFKQSFEERGHEYGVFPYGADAYIHAWSDGSTTPADNAVNIFYLRRFEYYTDGPERILWEHVDHLVCVNQWFADQMSLRLGKSCPPISVIHNAVYPGKWTFKERKPGKSIGMVCHVHPKKNLQLAALILAALPEGYSLHIAGKVQDQCTVDYLNWFAKKTKRQIYIYGKIPAEQMNFWWEQHQYCLSTSLSEGCPNNVIEAMAKGIKPIVHRWPGAETMFPETFLTVDQAVNQILSPDYFSLNYLNQVGERFSVRNNEKLVDLVEHYHALRTMNDGRRAVSEG